ncbi:hypothetical protein [Brevibacillus choshinensis]|uniref:hypothetical protein n=1 Tax=Brevibacillus choshinensis TaxID=54911 RepID=UPI002E1C78AD|nr:hypothetical protein [Brevibacillus choshinensis]
MRLLFKIALLCTVLFISTVSGSALAVPNPASYGVQFVGMQESYNSGDKIKLTVETRTSGDLSDIQFKVLPIAGGNSDGDVTSVKTTYNKKKYTYTTTGYFKPSSVGFYTIGFQATHNSFEGTKKIEVTTMIQVKNPNELTMSVSPHQSIIAVGQELPILITYNSKYKVTFEYSEPVTELITKKADGVYKKIILYKATESQKYNITITATQSKIKDVKSETITFYAD